MQWIVSSNSTRILVEFRLICCPKCAFLCCCWNSKGIFFVCQKVFLSMPFLIILLQNLLEIWRHILNLIWFAQVCIRQFSKQALKAFINLKITLEYRWFFCNLIQFARFICSFLEFSFLRCELNTIYNIFRTESLPMAHRKKRLVFIFNSCLWCNVWEHLAQHEIGFVCFALLWFSSRNITNIFVKIVQMKTRMNQQLFEFNFMAKREKNIAHT